MTFSIHAEGPSTNWDKLSVGCDKVAWGSQRMWIEPTRFGPTIIPRPPAHHTLRHTASRCTARVFRCVQSRFCSSVVGRREPNKSYSAFRAGWIVIVLSDFNLIHRLADPTLQTSVRDNFECMNLSKQGIGLDRTKT